MTLIGSRAMKYWFPEFPRKPFDWDYLIKDGESAPEKGGDIVECYQIPALQKRVGFNMEHLTPDLLYTLKMSHVSGWNIKWDKNLYDLVYLQNKGAILDKELFFELREWWDIVHGDNKRSDLNMSAEDFFDNAVNCPHNHDYLHTLLREYPTFNKVLKDGAEVDVCEEKFNNLSHEEKCDLVKEEVMIMAYERLNGRDYKTAYTWMLKKFILNHAPIWETIFILQNYVELHKPQFNYVALLNNKLCQQ